MTKVKKEKDPAQSTRWSYIGISCFLIALGVCAVVWPDIGLETVCVAIGVGAVLFGIIRVIVYFMREIRGVALSYDFSIGALCLIGGVILLIHPQGVLDFLQVVIGIYLLLDSVFKLQTALDSKRIGMSGWWVPLIFTVLCLVMGVLMVLKVGAAMVMTLIGAALIADGLQNLCLVLYAAAAAKAIRRMDKDGDGLPDIIDATDVQEAPEAQPVSEPPAAPAPEAPAAPERAVSEEITPEIPLDPPAEDEGSIQ